MNNLDLIQSLDNKSNHERLEIILQHVQSLGVKYSIQQYSSGLNLVVDLGSSPKKVGVSSHYDRVQNSAGANDNGSAIAVCLDIIRKHIDSKSNLGIRVFFFDEEETGLKGSKAYIKERGIDDLVGLINMELVGLGDKFALWPVNERTSGQLLTCFEAMAGRKTIGTKRFDNIITNTADHLPFQKAGLKDCFTVTCVSNQDIDTAIHYFKAMEFDVDKETLFEILSGAPIFKHYHQPTDTFEKLSEESIAITSETIWNTIVEVQKGN